MTFRKPNRIELINYNDQIDYKQYKELKNNQSYKTKLLNSVNINKISDNNQTEFKNLNNQDKDSAIKSKKIKKIKLNDDNIDNDSINLIYSD